ncbi:hypothetical protein SAMN04488523_101142 [Sulfitobacter brevis]|uniref:Uncharacterized protein n=1 Tax=Sulfitobacter brevis TaxID=74348 RepID=A0A1I1SSR3_9RHOB|nr:hypothetical protein [Sulfitobacter brevis]SFD49371.1 hypothetical protein SAMN04488523_101142 [Sulfitobacter brevis]
MSTSETTYLKGRAIARLLELFGWLSCGTGLLLIGTGLWSTVASPAQFATLGLLGSIALVAIGIVIAMTGLIAAQQAQTARATFQTAQDTRALLNQHHKSNTTPAKTLRAEPTLTAVRR